MFNGCQDVEKMTPKFTKLRSNVAFFAPKNVDTDQILPARFLHKPRKEDYGQYLFCDLGVTKSFGDAKILSAGTNFGCGSSRENAVWALYDFGFRAIIAPSFGDIFSINCTKNGIVPIRLDVSVPAGEAEVDLEKQSVTFADGSVHQFEIDPFARYCLLNGVDELEYTLSRMDEILKFEKDYQWENS
jgi:3-isopropylmalate/(R)-2-methylmalate dehydratase small subunit